MMHHSLYGSLAVGQDQLAAATAAALAADPMLASKDTTLTKIFVGGLPYHTDDKTLREYFEQFGEIDEAVVITDRQTGKSRGYGFVTMKDRAATERACRDPNPIIDGRKANVNLAYLGAKPRGNVALAAGLQTLPYQAAAAGLTQFLPGRTVPALSQLYYPGASPFGQAAAGGGLMLPGGGGGAVSPAGGGGASPYLDPYSAAALSGVVTSLANTNAAAQYAAAAAASYPAVSMASAMSAANGGYGSAADAAAAASMSTSNAAAAYVYSPTYGVLPASYAAQLGIPAVQLTPQISAALAAQGAAVAAAQQQVDMAQSRVVQ